ncbi:hypothetical protein A1Q2_02363 [Trichosporon asahii var. asahii CBS 8904]|uniref:Carboxylic ester hydrolase n=1 Tax=Trichosporon asahii var. asahii (strain CBS 8904) TaxID=1220162 RepID=K1WQL0_TRIAC|nr:hypothetical protein A1Q2_02363 [Trichosporon asahii var. asahii CBS 8904]
MKVASTFIILASLLGSSFASPAPVVVSDGGMQGGLEERATTITVNVPAGSIVGTQEIWTENFNGIPYAETAQRLRKPVRRKDPLVNWDATKAAAACPQQIADSDDPNFIAQVLSTVSETSLFKKALKISEDCLTVNVIRPKGVKQGDNLPVLFWIYGGGFELGWSSMYDGSLLVKSGLDVGKPFVFVAVNYRVAGWGFMPGKQVKAEGIGNLGLLDQRMGLEWVADNIAAFGGDPDKVTIWGESAGAISVFDQMAAYDGNNLYNDKPLFRGAIMNSGSMVPVDPVDGSRGQRTYDAVVKKAGCDTAPDSLQCLRDLPLDKFTDAANSVPAILSYQSVSLEYLPRPDGVFMTDSPDNLVSNKKYAAVPMIIGDQEDEGTLFALFQSNTSATVESTTDYLQKVFFPQAPRNYIEDLVKSYGTGIEALNYGSPHRTGIFNEIYPGFKRLAALLGDAVFTLTRRIFLEKCTSLNPDVPAWSYLASYNYLTPIMGTFHGADILQVFYGILPNYASRNIHNYYLNFLYNLDPNNASGGDGSNRSKVKENWPRWDSNSRQLINFYAMYFKQITDDFRERSAAVLRTAYGALGLRL